MPRTATSSSAGGYDLTEQNLAAIKDGHAYVTLGQSAFVQGYLPVALLVDAIRNKKTLEPGFYDSGTQIVTADSVDMGNALPAVSFEDAQAMAADPAATAEYYGAWSKGMTGDALHSGHAADRSRRRVTLSVCISDEGRSHGSPFDALKMTEHAAYRGSGPQETLRRRGRAGRHESRRPARHRPRHCRRERRRQIDTDEGAGRRGSAG